MQECEYQEYFNEEYYQNPEEEADPFEEEYDKFFEEERGSGTLQGTLTILNKKKLLPGELEYALEE